jgi:hypothetical protein
MAKIKDPILFSKHFGIKEEILIDAGFIDPFLNVDTQLFIDPVLLEKSENEVVCENGINAFKNHFNNFVRLLLISEKEGDAAWKAAQNLLDLHEPAENGLGYGGSSRSGSSRPNKIRDSMMRTSKEIISLGSKDPEMISLMGFFEEEVGPDTISDFTTRVIIKQLAEITEKFCLDNKIPVHESKLITHVKLPKYKDGNGKESEIILVPSDIVRDLPIANDWADIQEAALKNSEIRQRVNSYLGAIAQPTVADRKAALRYATLESSENFEKFLTAVKDNATHYDPNADEFGYYKLRQILLQELDEFKRDKKYDISSGPESLYALVIDTIEHFKHHVEKGNLWEELWTNGKPKKERAAQLIYYAIADCFCAANNLDVSPEANMGGGPIDFKFSKGYNARVLVEMKRSSGTVRHGYEKQLEIYKDASRTNYGIFVIMDFGDLGNKLNLIKEIQRTRIKNGEQASDIVVIDATQKESASKRK